MFIQSLVGVLLAFMGAAMANLVDPSSFTQENESRSIMSFEDKLLTVLSLSDYQGIGDNTGMISLSQDDFLTLLDVGLEQKHQPEADFSPVLAALADQTVLLDKVLQKLEANKEYP